MLKLCEPYFNVCYKNSEWLIYTVGPKGQLLEISSYHENAKSWSSV